MEYVKLHARVQRQHAIALDAFLALYMDDADTGLAVPLDDIWTALVDADSELLAVWLNVYRTRRLSSFDAYSALADDIPLATPRTYAFMAALIAEHGYHYEQCSLHYTIEYARACIDNNVRLGLQWVLAYGCLDSYNCGTLYEYLQAKRRKAGEPVKESSSMPL